MIDASGRVGVATATPAYALDVWGSLAVGTTTIPAFFVNSDTGYVGIGTTTPAQTLHVEGQCVTGDTLLPVYRGLSSGEFTETRSLSDLEFIQIKDIKGGEYVLSLNENTGQIQPAKIKGLLDMGVKPIYEIETEDGKKIRTTGNHPYLVKIQPITQPSFNCSILCSSNLSSQTKNNLPENSFGDVFCANNLESPVFSFSKCPGEILSKITEQESKNLGETNMCHLVKSQSWVMTTLSSESACEKTSPFLDPPGVNFTSCPNFLKKENNPRWTFSSNRNFIELFSQYAQKLGIKFSFFQNSGSVIQSSLDMFDGKGGEGCSNFLDSSSFSEHIQNLPDHNSGSFESGLAVADIGVSDNVFVEFNSPHTNFNDNKNENDLSNAVWTRVAELAEGDEIAVADNIEVGLQLSESDSDNINIKFVKIKRITELPPEQVYDIEVEGTHNFIANGIVAHNTYLSGNVGIGTSSPAYGLELMASSTLGYFGVSGSTQGDVFVIDASGRVGVATATPAYALDVWGNAAFGTTTTSLLFVNSDTGRIGVNTTTPAYDVDIWGSLAVGTTTIPALFVNSDTGLVGIGTTTPAYTLDVNGTLRVAPVSTGLGSVTDSFSDETKIAATSSVVVSGGQVKLGDWACGDTQLLSLTMAVQLLTEQWRAPAAPVGWTATWALQGWPHLPLILPLTETFSSGAEKMTGIKSVLPLPAMWKAI